MATFARIVKDTKIFIFLRVGHVERYLLWRDDCARQKSPPFEIVFTLVVPDIL